MECLSVNFAHPDGKEWLHNDGMVIEDSGPPLPRHNRWGQRDQKPDSQTILALAQGPKPNACPSVLVFNTEAMMKCQNEWHPSKLHQTHVTPRKSDEWIIPNAAIKPRRKAIYLSEFVQPVEPDSAIETHFWNHEHPCNRRSAWPANCCC